MPLPHVLTPTADPQVCRLAAPNSPIEFTSRVVKRSEGLPRTQQLCQASII